MRNDSYYFPPTVKESTNHIYVKSWMVTSLCISQPIVKYAEPSGMTGCLISESQSSLKPRQSRSYWELQLTPETYCFPSSVWIQWFTLRADLDPFPLRQTTDGVASRIVFVSGSSYRGLCKSFNICIIVSVYMVKKKSTGVRLLIKKNCILHRWAPYPKSKPFPGRGFEPLHFLFFFGYCFLNSK